MAITLYGIPNCDTVRRARSWLGEHGHAANFHDFKKQGVPADALDAWLERAAICEFDGGITRAKAEDVATARIGAEFGHRVALMVRNMAATQE